MSLRKIIFFILLAILLVGIIFGAWKLSQASKTPTTTPKKLTVWIVGDATEGFAPIIDGFKAENSQYNKTNIEFIKFGSYDEYTKTLLSVMADGKWPDIFVVDAGKDDLLESKIEPIPDSNFDMDDFYKRFDTVFFNTLIAETTDETTKVKTTYIKGVPLGYETLGIFYNKSAYPTFPTTWADLDLKYVNPQEWVLPAGLGLSPRYIQNGVDLIGLFLSYDKIEDYTSLQNASHSLESYISYSWKARKLDPSTSVANDESTTSLTETSTGADIWILKAKMTEENTTMTDLFVRGEVGMIFWYPSLVREIEYAKKRAWDASHTDIVLTAPMLKVAPDSPRKSIARYSYFAISKGSSNKVDALNFLKYLSTEWAQAKYLEAFPFYIAAQTSFHANQMELPLSPSFARAKIGSFIQPEQQNFIFHYGVWSTFEDWLYKIIDRSNNIDINKATLSLWLRIQCQIDQTLFQVSIWKNCSDIRE